VDNNIIKKKKGGSGEETFVAEQKRFCVTRRAGPPCLCRKGRPFPKKKK